MGSKSISYKATDMEIIEEAQNYDINKKINRTTLLEKLFIWSLITEPLLFFILSSSTETGLPLTLSRVLQLSFLVLYLLNILLGRKKLLKLNVFNSRYPYVAIYIYLVILSSLIGLFSGAYLLESHALYESAGFSFYLRPFLEIFILLYYFVYFLILPMYVIRTNVQLTYLLTWMLRVIYFVIVIGLIDVLCNVLGFDIIPRHLVDSSWITVGLRFHSIAGEPRDAFVYLMFAISLLLLKAIIKEDNKLGIGSLLVIMGCLILTQAFSGMVGILFGIILLVVFTKISLKNFIAFLSVMFVSVLIGYIAVKYSLRIHRYYDMVLSLPNVMQNVAELPMIVKNQSPDLVPLWLYLNSLFDFDLYTILFGSGIGSSSFAMNNFMGHNVAVVDNPRGQLTRLIFESGVIGLYVYLLVLIKPIKHFTVIINKKYQLITWISVLLFYGSVLGHRSNLALIFSGIIISIIMNQLYKSKLVIIK